MGKAEAFVENIIPGSIAEELGIEAGDTVVSVNGQKPRDLIDYRFLCADDELVVEVNKQNGETWIFDIQKDYDEDLGLVFARDTFDGIRNCTNKCIFCFVDQMPTDLRETLYIKDDDYRLSFLHGNFITLTNLTTRDVERIQRLRLSPLYISVHCTNAALRETILGNKRAGKIMQQLKMLAGAGIEMHTQIVLCPGINDGQELDRSIRDLSSLWPHIQSIAIVPVGLTGYRGNLHPLRKFSPGEAGELIDNIHRLQEGFLQKYDLPLVYLGDEFYVMAEREFPPAPWYGDYPQLENGVGLVRLFYDSFADESGRLPRALDKKRHAAIVTGVSGRYVLQPVVERLNKVNNLHVEAIGVENEFFGGDVTVAGLLTGGDVVNVLQERLPFDLILLPSVMCRRDEPVFLDGKTPADLANELDTTVMVINVHKGAVELIDSIIG